MQALYILAEQLPTDLHNKLTGYGLIHSVVNFGYTLVDFWLQYSRGDPM